MDIPGASTTTSKLKAADQKKIVNVLGPFPQPPKFLHIQASAAGGLGARPFPDPRECISVKPSAPLGTGIELPRRARQGTAGRKSHECGFRLGSGSIISSEPHCLAVTKSPNGPSRKSPREAGRAGAWPLRTAWGARAPGELGAGADGCG